MKVLTSRCARGQGSVTSSWWSTRCGLKLPCIYLDGCFHCWFACFLCRRTKMLAIITPNVMGLITLGFGTNRGVFTSSTSGTPARKRVGIKWTAWTHFYQHSQCVSYETSTGHIMGTFATNSKVIWDTENASLRLLLPFLHCLWNYRPRKLHPCLHVKIVGWDSQSLLDAPTRKRYRERKNNCTCMTARTKKRATKTTYESTICETHSSRTDAHLFWKHCSQMVWPSTDSFHCACPYTSDNNSDECRAHAQAPQERQWWVPRTTASAPGTFFATPLHIQRITCLFCPCHHFNWCWHDQLDLS